MNEKLHQLLTQLRLKGMAGALDQELRRAEADAAPVSEVLHRLLLEELAYRQDQSLLYRLKRARIPWDWTLKTFPFDKQPSVNKAQIQQLSGLSFVERKENIVLIGNPGTGKSGLAVGLLRQALLSGYRGRFYLAQDLLDELYASLADRSSPKLIQRLCRYDLLVIDELGYLTLRPEQVNAFFKLMGERYGKKATIVTTNLDYPEWYDLFQKKPLVDALLDRLKHHCITIRIHGPSLRVSSPASEKTNTKSGTTTANPGGKS
ncbi:MAG: ATP-binding protein [Deltaproteobacteria bacterium]|jgi:DNA replication protein DnaC|nr:MAG: ATP-binding protein [Deltaproteobacteria bacterium]